MDNVLKSGIIGGIAGFLLMIVVIVIFFSAWFHSGNTPLAALFMMAAFVLAFLVAGVMAGFLAFPSIKTALGSFMPGLIAGFVTVAIPLLFLILYILMFVYQWLSGDSLAWEYIGHMWPLILLMLVGIGMASLCSALTMAIVFFWREFYRPGPKPENEGDLESLGTLYDELWEDARTLVADMNQSIAVYRIAGLFMIISGIVLLAFAIAGWLRELAGGYSSFEFIFTIAATICGPAEIIVGSYLLVWYNLLKKRYVRLTRLERAAGD
jgi:hypothetical protein